MLNQPTSSPMITTMLGFFSCASADEPATQVKARVSATVNSKTPKVFRCMFILFSFLDLMLFDYSSETPDCIHRWEI
jgi:hypothetical protein